MYVPVDPQNPTWDATFKVGFWRWLTSSKRERQEWFRLRQAAARNQTQQRQVEDRDRAARLSQWIAGQPPQQPTTAATSATTSATASPAPPRIGRSAELPQAPRTARPPRRAAPRKPRRRRGRFDLDGMLYGVELLLIVGPVLVFVICGAGLIWLGVR